MSATALLALAVPVAVVLGLLWVSARVRRVRSEAIERQIAMTDAIHRNLGAVVAPTVTRTLLGDWRVLVPVPFERPQLVGRVLEIARESLARAAAHRGGRWQIVLVEQARPARCRVPRAAIVAAARPSVTGQRAGARIS